MEESIPEYTICGDFAIDDELKCPICLEVYSLDAVSCKCCMNAFCKPCIESIQRCPLCRKDLRPIQKIPLPLRNILAKIKVQCNACKKDNITRGDFDHHVQHVCPIDCPHGCLAKTTRAKLLAHDAECPNVPIDCSAYDVGCAFQANRREMLSHETLCPFLALRPVLTKNLQEIARLNSLVHAHTKRIRELEAEVDSSRPCKRPRRKASYVEGNPALCPTAPSVPSIIVPRPLHPDVFSLFSPQLPLPSNPLFEAEQLFFPPSVSPPLLSPESPTNESPSGAYYPFNHGPANAAAPPPPLHPPAPPYAQLPVLQPFNSGQRYYNVGLPSNEEVKSHFDWRFDSIRH
eukprot:TRINITY_DN26054_c0_g1_i1.p1 TRINITY_DN26054_c0_g1~~TRINITY_DN26054_c0_g1_i1.p1  ORF type:complete len:346 (-),score=44.52 TRINITY_DN26054_c0_g1_i1:36-1073(-)